MNTAPQPFINYAQCPNCKTIFGLRDNQITSDDGKVRCGNCFQLFIVSTNTVNNPSTATISRKNTTPIISTNTTTAKSAAVHRIKKSKSISAPQADAIIKQSRQKPGILRTLVATAFSFVLLTSFCLQVLWVDQQRISQHHTLHNIYSYLCDFIGCEVASLSALNQLEIQARDLRAHPHYENALRLQAIVHNNALFAQPFANLNISFTDINGNKLATRVFQPKDYLEYRGKHTPEIPANGLAHILIDIVDPGENAVGYTLSFR